MKQFVLILLFSIVNVLANAQQYKKTIIYFESDQWHLTYSHQITLDSIISSLQNQQNYNLSIHGHTDNIGDSLYNLRLSKRRSSSVTSYLKLKLQYKNISTNFHGESNPVEMNSNDRNRALNRRVEIIWSLENSPSTGYIKNLKEFYKLISPPPQEFCINNKRDTVIQGEEGTIIYINANSFDVPNNSEECVKITLKERYKKSLIVRDNLTTITQNNKTLISQAMFEIDSNSPLKPGENLITITPTDTIVKSIKPFYGQFDEDDIMHWSQSADEISNISGANLDDLLNGGCSKDTIIIKDSTVYDTLNGECRLFFCKIFDWIGIKKYVPVIDSTIASDTLTRKVPTPCQFPGQFQPFSPSNLTLEQMKDISEDSLKYYVFSTNRLGWRNLDWLMKIKNTTSYKVNLEPDKDIDIKMIFKKYRSVVPLFPTDSYYSYAGAPIGYEAWLLAFKIEDGKAYLAIKEIKINEKDLIT